MKNMEAVPTTKTWQSILADAYMLFDDLRERGYGEHPFSLGGGTVLMLDYKHRLSKDIDFFAHDVQWLGLLSPRLNDVASSIAKDYQEQANSIKITTGDGDIDFVVARDVTDFERKTYEILGRHIPVDPPSEILAKKMFYRAETFKARDVYDLSAVIDLAPNAAAKAVRASAPKHASLLARLEQMKNIAGPELLSQIVPYDGGLHHAKDMISKCMDFIIHDRDRRKGFNKDPSEPEAKTSDRFER